MPRRLVDGAIQTDSNAREKNSGMRIYYRNNRVLRSSIVGQCTALGLRVALDCVVVAIDDPALECDVHASLDCSCNVDSVLH